MRYDREVSHTMNIISVLLCLLLLLLLSVRHLHYKSFPNSLDWTFNYTWECVQRLHEAATKQAVSLWPGADYRWDGEVLIVTIVFVQTIDGWQLEQEAQRPVQHANHPATSQSLCSLATMPPTLSLSPEPQWQFHETWSLSSHYDHFAVD